MCAWHVVNVHFQQLGKAKVLRGLRKFVNLDRPEHHCTDRLKERGVEKGRGFRKFVNLDRPEHLCTDRLKERVEKGNSQHSILQGCKRSAFKQTNISELF